MKNELMKKLTSVLLVVCMLASFVPPVLAAEGDEAEPAEIAEEVPAETAPEAEPEAEPDPDPTAEPVQEPVQAPAETEPAQEPVEAEPAQAPAQEAVPAASAPVQEAPAAAQPAAPVEAIAMPQGMELRDSTLAIAAGSSFTTDQIAGAIAGAESPVTAIENRGTIAEGAAAIGLSVLNYQGSAITGGTFTGDVSGYVKITGGVFHAELTNPAGRISGGTFYAAIDTGANTLIISGGEFYGNVKGRNLIISGGTFMESSTVNIVSVGGIEGGEFYGDVDCRYSLLRAGTFYGTVENRSGVFYEDEENQLVFAPEATIHNDVDGRIYAGTYPCIVVNDGEIHGGTFNGELTNNGTIYDGVFEKPIVNNGVILGGTFNDSAVNNSRILGGMFNGATTNYSLIFGGTFLALADMSETVTLPEGLRISSDGKALVLEADHSFDTDTLNEMADALGVDTVENHGTITAGSEALAKNVVNVDLASIQGGEFDGTVSGYVNITGGVFNGPVGDIYGFIRGGTFNDAVHTSEYYVSISGGTFNGPVGGRSIGFDGGEFHGAVEIATVGSIGNGEFYGPVSVRSGIIHGGRFHGDVTLLGSDAVVQDGVELVFDADMTITSYGVLYAAEYPCAVVNYGTIKDGNYTNEVTNYGVIEGGTFSMNVTNTGVIRGGVFNGGVNGEDGGVILREGFDISDDRTALIVNADVSVTTDDILEVAGWADVTAVENRGTITAGENAMTLPLTNNGAIQGGVFQADVTNTGKGAITSGTFNSALINSGSVTGGTLNGAIRAKGGRISGCTYGGNAAVEELAGGSYVEVHYYTVSNGQTSAVKSAAYGANVLSTLGKPATGYSWYAGSNDSEDNLVGADDTFSLETVTYVQVRGAAPAINWDSVTASTALYGAALSTSKLSYSDPNGTFAWKAPTTKLTVEGGRAGYTVVYTPSAASLAAYDYSGVAMEMDVPVQVKPREITLYLYNATKNYGSADPKLWGAYTGTIGNDVFSFTVTREPGENAGKYNLIAQYEENPNYTVTVVPATLTIYKMAVTITANAAEKTVGESDPVFTATVSAIPAGYDPVSYSLVRDLGENAGTYAIRVVAGDNPNYQVTAATSGTFTIKPKSLAAADIAKIAEQQFTGSAVTPAAVVTDGGVTLQSGKDYTVSYKDNTWPGTATVTVTGKGNYQGTAAEQFVIVASDGWKTVSGKQYFFRGGAALTGLQTVDGKSYYFDATGAMQTGWQTVSGKKYYFGTDGAAQTGWQTVSGKKYYFSTAGVMQTGWQTISGKKYYFNSSGVMLTGLQTISGKKYYFNASGVMQTGWQTISGKKYYFNASGAAQTGWQTISGKKYYFNSSGAMLTGLQTISGKKYYFNASGVMQTGWKTINGKKYYFGTNGASQTGWQTISGKKYYFKSTGVMATGWQTINGKRYYFKSNGVMVTGKYKISGKTYTFGSNGVLQS